MIATPTPARWLTTLLPAGRPRRVSTMSNPGQQRPDGSTRGKYEDTRAALDLTAHVAGTATYACTLDRDGQACAGVIDIDTGGEAALFRVLQALQAEGLEGAVITLPGANGAHDGGHIWLLYDQLCDAEAIRAQLQALATAAGLVGGELWPSSQVIRLPFGLHRTKGTRGTLYLTTSEFFNLDTPDGLQDACTAWAALPRNPAPPAVERPAPRIPVATPTAPAGGRLSTREVIDRFNAAHPLDALIVQYGGQRTRDGWACNCGVDHSHETQLQILDRGMVSYSPRCGWAPHVSDHRATDAFGLYTIVEHGGDTRAALKALQPSDARQRRPSSAGACEADAAQRLAAQRSRDAARKRQERQAQATAIRADVEARAAADDDLTPADRAVLATLLLIAGERGWCRPSKARLAEMTGYSEGSVKRALMHLEAGGYFMSEGDGGGPNCTAVRTFLRGSFSPAEGRTFLRGSSGDEMIHESIDTRISQEESLLACEGAPHSTPIAAAEPAGQAVTLSTPQPEAPTSEPCAPLTSPEAASEAPQPAAGSQGYSLEGVRYADGREGWRVYDDALDQVIGEYPTEAEALRIIADLEATIATAAPETPSVSEAAPLGAVPAPVQAVSGATYDPTRALQEPDTTPPPAWCRPDWCRPAGALGGTLREEAVPTSTPAPPPRHEQTGRFPASHSGRRRSADVSPRYLADLALMDRPQLAGELRKQQCIQAKHRERAWVSQIQRKIDAILHEFQQRLPSSPPPSHRRFSPAPRGSEQQLAFA